MAVSQTSGQTNIWQLSANGDVLTGPKRVYAMFLKSDATAGNCKVDGVRDGVAVALYPTANPGANALALITTGMPAPDPGIYNSITFTTNTGDHAVLYVVTDDDCIRG